MSKNQKEIQELEISLFKKSIQSLKEADWSNMTPEAMKLHRKDWQKFTQQKDVKPEADKLKTLKGRNDRPAPRIKEENQESISIKIPTE